MMTVHNSGRVESFKTDSPKDLRLEKVKDVEGKRPWKVARALAKFSGPVPIEDLVEAVKKDG